MNVDLLGDLHGAYSDKFGDGVIQLGDLGFDYSQWENPNCRRYFIDGNHDNFNILYQDDFPREVVPGLVHIPRGYLCGEVLFIGGASSIDRNHRRAGTGWWPEEEVTRQQIEDAMETHKGENISVVVAHDVPYSCLARVVPDVWEQFTYSNRQLEKIRKFFKPDLWICGHHHKSADFIDNGTRYAILNIDEKRTFDLPMKGMPGVPHA